jgi:thiol-disulfide isomerase/thioredoxin
MNKLTILIFILAIGIIIAKNFRKKPKYINGEAAPGFSWTAPDGKTISLEDFKGKYVLLDFWGSWCPPCRKENPHLVTLYNKYNKAEFKDASGLDIISVGVETEEAAWKNAIEKDGLIWPNHYSDFKRFKSDIVTQYGVKNIPTKYLIDEDGSIIGVNQSIEDLDKFLADRMKN